MFAGLLFSKRQFKLHSKFSYKKKSHFLWFCLTKVAGTWDTRKWQKRPLPALLENTVSYYVVVTSYKSPNVNIVFDFMEYTGPSVLITVDYFFRIARVNTDECGYITFIYKIFLFHNRAK